MIRKDATKLPQIFEGVHRWTTVPEETATESACRVRRRVNKEKERREKRE